MPNTHQEIWNNCLGIIRDIIPPISYKTWFEPIVPIKLVEQTLTIQVPSPFFYEYLEEQYIDLLKKTLYKTIGDQAKLEYSIVMTNQANEPCTVNYPTSNTNQLYNKPMDIPISNSPEKTIKNPFVIPGIQKLHVDPRLQANNNFDTYIEGECNSLARAAGYAVAQNPGGTAFNPLMIFGRSGLGKTHLAQAIGIETKQRFPEKTVLYVAANYFMNQYTEASKNGNINDFMYFYQMIDVLILDDVQELAGKTKTQLTFFHIFNHLHQSGKQLILTSDTSPIDLGGMEERLLSRFKWGLSAEIEAPDFETRMRILKNKAHKDGMTFSDDVLEYIASHITTNVRELEGALVSLLAQATLNKKEITLDLASKLINKLVKSTKVELSVDYISKVVCDSFGLEVEAIQSKTRKREIVQARQLAMFFSKEMTNQSYSAIGAQIGKKDHATVLHACKVIKNLIETDKDFKTTFHKVEQKLKL
ncbi:MAG: chromosomal replication initiator protein DnaA [Mangrovibacterium sp.]